MQRRSALGFLLVFASGLACNHAGRKAAWEVAVDKTPPVRTATVSESKLEADALVHWQKRDDQAELIKAIDGWERVVAEDAKNARALVQLSRAYYFLADAFLAIDAIDDEALELQTFEKGVNAGEKALLLIEPEFEKLMRADPEQFEDAIGVIGAAGAPAAFWYCANVGRFASKKGLRARLFYRDRVETAMLRVLELDENFFHAGPHRFLGGFYSAVPSIAGKSLDKSREHFAKAKLLAPEYLGTWVVEAQYLAIELEDRVLFEELLRSVLAKPDGDDPEIGPENRAAKRTAEQMLKDIDDKF